MTDLTDPHPRDAAVLLSQTTALTNRVRRAQRATWFPLLVFAAVTLVAVPVEALGTWHTHCVSGPGPVASCVKYSYAGLLYWPLAMIAAYVAISSFYVVRSRRQGLGTRVWPYVVTGIALAVLVIPPLEVVMTRMHTSVGVGPGWFVFGSPMFATDLLARLLSVTGVIGLALLVLAWVERSKALTLFTLGYLALVVAPITYQRFLSHPSMWPVLMHFIVQGLYLLAGTIGFYLAEHRDGVRA